MVENKINNVEQRFRNKITIVSFILAVFVVYIHGNNTTTYVFDFEKPFDDFVFWFEDWCQGWQHVSVPLFYIISGFLFFRNYSEKKCWEKIRKRVVTVLIPYIIWNLVPWILLIIMGRFSFSRNISISADLSLRSLYSCLVECRYSVLWYVRNLIVFFAATPVLYFFIKERNKKIGLFLILLVISGNFAWLICYGNKPEVLYWLPFYLMGSWIAVNKPYIFINQADKRTRVLATIGLALCIIWAMFPKYLLFNVVFEYLYRLIIPLVFWYYMDWFSFSIKPTWLLSLSFPIYCLHDILSSPIEKVIVILFGNKIMIALGSYLFTPILVIMLIVIFCKNVKTLFPKGYSILFGSRG